MAKKLKVELVKSLNGETERQKANVRTLGLIRMHRVRILNDTPVFRGIIARVSHLVKVEEIES